MINSNKIRNIYLLIGCHANGIDTISLNQWYLELFIQNAYFKLDFKIYKLLIIVCNMP